MPDDVLGPTSRNKETLLCNMSQPSGQSHVDISLALLCGLGGVAGYLKKRSVPSLLGGLGFSAAYAASGYYINNVDAAVGHQLGCVTSLVLTAMMGMRLMKTRKVMPAGVLTGTGLLGLVYHYQKWQEWKA